VSERVDGVEGRVVRFFDSEVTHVSDKCGFFEAVFCESFVAECDGFFVEIQPVALVSGFEHSIKESTCTAGGFKESFAFAFDVFIECGGKEFVFSDPVASEDQIVVDWIVVNTLVDGFHDSRYRTLGWDVG